MEAFFTTYLAATAAVLTATLIADVINSRRRAKRLQATRDLIKAVEEARDKKPRPKRERGNGGGYL